MFSLIETEQFLITPTCFMMKPYKEIFFYQSIIYSTLSNQWMIRMIGNGPDLNKNSMVMSPIHMHLTTDWNIVEYVSILAFAQDGSQKSSNWEITISLDHEYFAWCHYNMANFLQKPHNRLPIAYVWGRSYQDMYWDTEQIEDMYRFCMIQTIIIDLLLRNLSNFRNNIYHSISLLSHVVWCVSYHGKSISLHP